MTGLEAQSQLPKPQAQGLSRAEQKARARRRSKEAGIALIMVLGAIAVLTVAGDWKSVELNTAALIEFHVPR